MPKKRKGNTRTVKPVMHIFCEGDKTEPNYINGYLKSVHQGNRRLKIVVVEKTRKNTPVQLVDEALEAKKNKSTPDGDVFWVVYDRESVAKYDNELHKKVR